MKRISIFLLSSVAAIGCSRDNASDGKELAALKTSLDTIQTEQNKFLANQESILKAQKEILTAVKAGSRSERGAAQPRPRPPARPRPNPNSVYSVDIDGAPFKGVKNAKVTIVEAFEFAWPYCQKVGPTIESILKEYKGDVKIVYKNYVVHPQSATAPALAACAAGMQGKFDAMEHDIWEKAYAKGRDFSVGNLEAIAKGVGLNMRKYKTDLETCKTSIQKDQKDLAAVGTRGTPAFYINGRFLSGAQPLQNFKQLIDEELNKANAVIAKGEASASDYYDKIIYKKGLKKLDIPK